MKPPYEYAASCIRVIDGDTIDVRMDFGFKLRQEMRLRLAGIDTPELRSKDEVERDAAQVAKEFVHKTLFYEETFDSSLPGEHSRNLIVRTIKTKAGKERQTFGRYVAVVYFQAEKENVWENLNELLVKEGLAERSTG